MDWTCRLGQSWSTSSHRDFEADMSQHASASTRCPWCALFEYFDLRRSTNLCRHLFHYPTSTEVQGSYTSSSLIALSRFEGMIEHGFSRLQCSISEYHFRCKRSALSPSLPATWSNFGSEIWSNCAFAFYFFALWKALTAANFVVIKPARSSSIAILSFDQSYFAFLLSRAEGQGPSCQVRRPQHPGPRWYQKTVTSLFRSRRKSRFLLALCSNDEATLTHLVTGSKFMQHWSQFPRQIGSCTVPRSFDGPDQRQHRCSTSYQRPELWRTGC